MKTKIFKQAEIDQAVELLKNGELVAFPTETVYGLGALATNEQAVKNVYLAKGRPSDNPLIVTVNGLEMVKEYALEIPEDAQKLVKKFWPGPLTMLLKVKPGTLPNAVTGGLKTVAFRNPDDQLTNELITKLGKPIVGPSANTSTKPSPTTCEHVYHDLQGKIAGIIDGGETKVGLESTIIDLTVDPYVVLRPGRITSHELSACLGKDVLLNRGKPADGEIPKAPGMKYRHYAPSCPVWIVDKPADFEKLPLSAEVGVAACSDILSKLDLADSQIYDLGKNLESADQHLFASLRYFDQNSEIKKIFVQGFDQGEASYAYMNRLNKAASGQHFKK
ncbi:MAG: L-threonylcarbamoyladenylate synthase [Lactobacillus sp.]|nr:L-threonylcarbamoyladenylate synthase [Lactobacillus sp.]